MINYLNCELTPSIPFRYRQQVDDQIKEMVKFGIDKKVQTEYIIPMVTVQKKDGSLRMCLDARSLNFLPDN